MNYLHPTLREPRIILYRESARRLWGWAVESVLRTAARVAQVEGINTPDVCAERVAEVTQQIESAFVAGVLCVVARPSFVRGSHQRRTCNQWDVVLMAGAVEVCRRRLQRTSDSWWWVESHCPKYPDGAVLAANSPLWGDDEVSILAKLPADSNPGKNLQTV